VVNAMIPPEKIELHTTLFGSGPNGRAVQHYRNREFKIDLVCIRQKSGLPFVEHWAAEALPDQIFTTYPMLRKAMAETKQEGGL